MRLSGQCSYVVLDYETDAVIQTSLRTELDKDVTVITVAHRLQTVMDYDKIVNLCHPHTWDRRLTDMRFLF